MKNLTLPLNTKEILDYINIGRGDEKHPVYTEDDIKEGTPSEEKLCWAITESGRLIPNAGYYKDKQQWAYAYVVNGLAHEAPINEKIIAFIKYK
ncbi:MAG: hypothetical protein IJ588_13765 [Prevotella sp.]|nr:hypothetical protein [Prevotella sp.]